MAQDVYTTITEKKKKKKERKKINAKKTGIKMPKMCIFTPQHIHVPFSPTTVIYLNMYIYIYNECLVQHIK